MERLDQAQLFHDINSLDTIRQQSKSDDKAALRQAAEQFESMFWSELLKSMRKAEDVIAADSPFNSQSTQFYRDMQDQQLAVDLASKGSLGLADLLMAQFDPGGGTIKPTSALQRDDLQRTEPAPSVRQKAAPAKVNPAPVEVAAPEPAPLAANIETAAQQPDADRFDSPKDFVDKLLPHAQNAAKALGLDPAVLLAQAALETGWGQKVIRDGDGGSSFNLFNIKADRRWQGDAVSVGTLEYKDGLPVKERAAFRSYPDFSQSFADYVDFLKSNNRYQDALQKTDDSAEYLHELQRAGYATDPNYANKILGVLSSGVMRALSSKE